MALVIIDDSRTGAELLRAQLETVTDSSILTFMDPRAALESCRDIIPDLVITDYVMPGMDGADFIQAFRKLKDREEVPIIVVTGREDRETRLRALHAGANDFLTKPVDEIELQARVRNMLKLRARSRALASAIARLQELATTDELTRVNNRRHFLEILRTELNRARRQNWPLSVAMVDVDHFKSVNDNWGHGIGDDALRHLAALFTGSVRDHDSVGRLGGEEFALCLPVTPGDRATMVAERLCQRVRKSPLMTKKGELALTVSVGVAEWSGPAEDPAALLVRADEALYEAKHGGRDRVVVSEKPDNVPQITDQKQVKR